MGEDSTPMTAKSTIAHLIASNFVGGPEKQILEHAKRLDPARFRFVLISFVESGTENELLTKAKEQGILTVALHTNHPFNPLAIVRLKRILEYHRIDILCSHGYKANVLGRLATWLRTIPLVAVSRGWTAENRKIRFYEWLDKLFLKFATHVVAVSDGQKEKILRLSLAAEKISVIHNAISLDVPSSPEPRNIRSELGLPADCVLVVTAGRLSPEKNHVGMIDVARIVCAQAPNVYFIIFGEGFLRSHLEDYLQMAELADRVLLPGFRKDLPAVLPEIDVFMLPSFTEGLPNVALEAFAARKPIVATAVGGTPEVVSHGESGFLAQPEEVSLLATYVSRLVADPKLRIEMGNRGFQHVRDIFGFEKQTCCYEELYLKISGNSTSRHQNISERDS